MRKQPSAEVTSKAPWPGMTSDKLCEQMYEKQGGTTLLAFSRGKDSIAAWLQLQRFRFQVVPYHLYLVPGLQFIEDSLKRFEDAFGVRIHRLPHPSLFRLLSNFVFQPPEHCATIERAGIQEFTYEELQESFCRDLGLLGMYTATGVRATDSPTRMLAVRKHGAVNHKQKHWWPVYDWNLDRVVDAIRTSGVRLPIDYKWWNNSHDGLDYRFSEPLSRYSPKDWQEVLFWFPLAELELLRTAWRADGCKHS